VDPTSLVLEALQTFGPWKAVVLKNDAAARRLEKLPESVAAVAGAPDRPHWFQADGLHLAADLLEGQKTGYFFDQRANRASAARLAKGQSVLDVFCHTGGFGLACAQAGATRVTGIDESDPALNLAIHPRLCVNLRQLWETDTIEFRHFPGTVDPERLQAAVEWCREFVKMALREGGPKHDPRMVAKYYSQKLPTFKRYDHWLETGYQMTSVKYWPRADLPARIEAWLEEQRNLEGT
jgi:hypothetical protein